jgi:hypothetical protein
MKCIGRLQQLNEFCSYSDIDKPKHEDENTKFCDMCRLAHFPFEVLPPSKSNADEIEITKWVKVCCKEKLF